jgi:hypothetical protein
VVRGWLPHTRGIRARRAGIGKPCLGRQYGLGTPAQEEVAVTSRTGGYTLTRLMPGRYKIEFSTGCGACGFATQWWDNAASATSAKVIKVGFTAIAGIDATLRR